MPKTITQSETVTAAAVTNPVFTYQGRLTEEGNPATGTYDFVFTLYDAPTDGTQVGNAILMEDVDVNDGFFTVPLDFGSDIFLRGTLFLEIRLRTGSATEEYTILAPRRAITSTPYAAYASHASALSAPDGDPFNAVVIDDDGKMGIGTPDPDALMDISGKVSDTIGVNHLLQFNNTFGFRIDSTTGHNLFVDTYNSGWNLVPALTVNRVAGNVGIGTSNPTQRLAVTGNISATGEFIVNSQAVLGQGPSDTGGGFDRIWIGDGNSADGSSALALRAGGADHMWISESGKVGIGTTRPETVLEVRSPDSDEIENLIVVRKDNQRGDGKQFFVQMQPAVPDVLLTTNGTGLHPSLSLGAGSSAKHMTIATSGNIGMGTANPNFPLEVNRDQITNDLVNIRTQGVNLWTIGKEGGIGASSLKALDKPILLAHPDETHGMALGPNVHWSDVATTGNLNLKGNVGIGTNSPQSALQVNGYTQLALTSGAPPSIDCNNATRGRMKVDSAAGLLYVCMDSGWVGK